MSSAFTLTVVGCSGSYPGPDSSASCYLLTSEQQTAQGVRTWRVLLDFGNGSLGALQRVADPLTIDAVVLSHLHPDHCMDLCGYYVLRTYHPNGAQPKIPVHAPAGAAERMACAYGLGDGEPGMTQAFDFLTFAGPFDIGPFRITPTRVVHPVEAFSLRVEAHGRTLTYSGDTARCDALETAAQAADLFLCEASFLESDDNPPGIHLTGLDAAQVAADAGVGRLLLTHVPPWHSREDVLADALGGFAGDLAFAAPGASYDV